MNRQTTKETFEFIDKRGRISATKLLDFLYPNRRKPLVKPVLTSIAQSKKLCEIQDLDIAEFDLAIAKIEKIKREDPVLYNMIEVMINGSCRISEVLNLTSSDYKSTGHVYVKGLKGSENRLIPVFESRQYFKTCRSNSVDPFIGYDRFFVYRQLRKYGIGRRFEGKSKQSVTHYFRQMTLRMMQMEDVSQRDRSKQAGHKSSKSIEYYESNQKKSS